MRTLILLFALIQAPAYANGIQCDSDGDSDYFRGQIEILGKSPLCGFHPEYTAGFRVVVIPSFDQAKVMTVFQRHDGTVDLDGEHSVGASYYAGLISAFKKLNIFELENYETLVDLYCDFSRDPLVEWW